MCVHNMNIWETGGEMVMVKCVSAHETEACDETV